MSIEKSIFVAYYRLSLFNWQIQDRLAVKSQVKLVEKIKLKHMY